MKKLKTFEEINEAKHSAMFNRNVRDLKTVIKIAHKTVKSEDGKLFLKEVERLFNEIYKELQS